MIATAFSGHFEFLYCGFPDLYSDLSTEQYIELILDFENRVFFAGNVAEYITPDGLLSGFTVWDDQMDEASTVTYEQVRTVYFDLGERFEIGPLYFVPAGPNQHEAVKTWGSDVPTYKPD